MPLNPLRTLIAILIAFSLAFAPVASAMAMRQQASMPATSGAPAEQMDTRGSADMAGMDDCAKMMAQAAHDKAPSDCHCCDPKSKCPDAAACLMKCGMQALATLVPISVSRQPAVRHARPVDLQNPPDWERSPPARPPRA